MIKKNSMKIQDFLTTSKDIVEPFSSDFRDVIPEYYLKNSIVFLELFESI